MPFPPARRVLAVLAAVAGVGLLVALGYAITRPPARATTIDPVREPPTAPTTSPQ